MSESPSGLEDMMMGNVSEETSESNESIQARIDAARAKMASIRKDESAAHNFDIHLAKILPSLPRFILEFVIYLINKEVPSLTILSMIAIASDDAGKICHQHFYKFVEEKADFSSVKISLPLIESKISWWWTFIFGADHSSKTVTLSEFANDDAFIKTVSQNFSKMLQYFFEREEATDFDAEKLKSLMKEYANKLFAKK